MPWKQLDAALGYAVLAAIILGGGVLAFGGLEALTSWPVVAVLAVASIVLGLLAGNVGGLRSRLPILNAPSRPVAAVGWASLLLLSTAALIAATPSEPRTSGPARPAAGAAKAKKVATRPPASPAARSPAPSPAASASPEPGGSPVAAPTLEGFDPSRYLGQGNAYNCAHLRSQAEAQAILRADPSDPNVLDNDRDGIACESSPPPRDTVRVPR